tara:strand:- start:104 stop:499 length:396 start_codon:yes stop_codon:yes gene_type:complete
VAEVEVDDDDVKVLLTGGAGSIIKSLGEKFDKVNVDIRREKEMMRLRGPKGDVESYLKEINLILRGGEGKSVVDIVVGADDKGLVIGPKGATIKKFEQEHEIRINLLDKSDRLRLRGDTDNVEAARVAIER